MTHSLRPAIISVEKGRVQALELVQREGILAVPVDRGYRYIGDVFQQEIVVDGMTVKRWFAMTLVEANLGPFTSRHVALAELLKWNNIRPAGVEETTEPLFPI